MADETTDKGWCVLELMGHRKLAGYLSDDGGLTRVDVYLEAGAAEESWAGAGRRLIATQWYGASAIYCITATTMENCLALTESHQPTPIGRWELPAPEHQPVGGGRLGEERDIDDADVEADDGSGY